MHLYIYTPSTLCMHVNQGDLTICVVIRLALSGFSTPNHPHKLMECTKEHHCERSL